MKIPPALVACWFLTLGTHPAVAEQATTKPAARAIDSLAVEHVQVQGLRRAVRFYQPKHLAKPPALLIALHGGGGDGERFRRFTDRAFERLADRHAKHFRMLAGLSERPIMEWHTDRNIEDGARVETRRWVGTGGAEVVMIVMHGGGHTMPHPSAKFPANCRSHQS